MSLLVVMGSGETAPTMVKIHREVLAASAASGTGLAVMLDTPFGFQLNADDLVARTRQYFADSVGTPVQVVGWRRADAPQAEQDQALALLSQATWAFAGPGSPTYALRQWQGTAIPDALLDVADRGGTLVFGSAAACTLGVAAIPVYEIYKVGEEPRWATGLDLLGRLTGIPAVVVPHYDNAEGGQYDTRFCYLGEPRLARLEAELAEGTGVLGVDEHTALVIDTAARTARVAGNGRVTVRYRGRSELLAAGTELTLEELAAGLRGGEHGSGWSAPEPAEPAPGRPALSTADPASPLSLKEETALARSRFDTAVEGRDVDGAVGAILALEAAIAAWNADTLQSDDSDRARRVMRSLIVRLGALAHDGVRDPREALAPLVEGLLEVRSRARTAKDFATSDLIRDRLAGAQVEVRDTPDGQVWSLAGRSE